MRMTQNNFNGGEFGCHLNARIDLEKYTSSCSLLENFNPLPWGDAENRAGSRFVAACKYDDKTARLIPFEFNVEQTYIIEAGDKYFRFFADGAPIIKNSVPYEISTPYDHSTIFKLRYKRSADVLFLVHPDYPPKKLSRYANDDWRLESMDFKGGPFKDENVEDITVTASAVTGNITLTASDDIFESGMEGSFFQIMHPRENGSVAHTFTADGASPTNLEIKGTWHVETTGSWNGTLVLERSFDNGTSWQNVRTWTSNQDRNIDDEGFESSDDVVFRLKMTNWSNPQSQTLECKTTLSVEDYWVRGIVEISAVNSATSADATVIDELAKTDATRDWAFGAWNDYSGYPGCLCFYQDRLCFAATYKQPQTVWLSATGDYVDFRASTLPDGAMNYTFKGTSGIQWMLPKRHIAVGSRINEGMFRPVNEDEPLTPENRTFDPETQYGSHGMEAVLVNDAILFAQRGARKIRELAYNFEADGYRAPDMSIYAPHILEGGCNEIYYKQLPNSILYCMRDDGQIAGFTYERSQNVTAWFRYVTQGKYLSGAVKASDSDDEHWVIVERTINGFVKRFVEYFEKREFSDQSDCFFVDCGLTYYDNGIEATEISGLDHLEGETVSILADGAEVAPQIVNGGKITIPSPAVKVHVGLGYESQLSPMPLEFFSSTGPLLGIEKRVNKIILKLLESHGGKVCFSNGKEYPVHYRKTSDPLDSPPVLFTGYKEIPINSGTDKIIIPTIKHSTPLPITLQAVIFEMEVSQ